MCIHSPVAQSLSDNRLRDMDILDHRRSWAVKLFLLAGKVVDCHQQALQIVFVACGRIAHRHERGLNLELCKASNTYYRLCKRKLSDYRPNRIFPWTELKLIFSKPPS
jgi:hypothetical protein